MHFYRLGHSWQLAIGELKNIANNTDSTSNFSYLNDQNYLVSPTLTRTDKIAGIVFSGQVLTEIRKTDDLYSSLSQFLYNNPLKKIGVSIPENFNDGKSIIPFLKEHGVQKTNLLIGKEPNFGHFQQNYPWLLVFKCVDGFYLGHIQNWSNQEIFIDLDNGLPAGSMKRGKMNLKLALGLINLVSGSYQYLWDPFCGQGGLLAVNHVFGDKSMIATDLDRPAIRHTKLNMDWLSGQDKINFNTEIKLLQAERMDAGKLASQSKDSNLLGIIRKIEPGFDFSKTVIVTEGTLGPVYGRILPSKSQLIENLTQIKDLVSKFLGQAQILQIPEIVFCVPFYKLNDGDLSIVDFDQVIPNEYTLDKILPGKEYIDYSRPNTLVGHRIYRLKFNI